MKQITWDDYYEKFYDWSESTQIRNLSGLTSLGPADEVAEIIMELQFNNEAAANRLLKKANEAQLAFLGSDLVEFVGFANQTLLTEAVRHSAKNLTSEDMEDLVGEIDDQVIIEICKKQHILLPEDLRKEDEDDSWEVVDQRVDEQLLPKRIGFFAAIAALIERAKKKKSLKQPHQKHHCDGDCANCPPHYGYRYGRWYYGHDHVYGCEFCGNKGSRSKD